jgi:23S rRNA (uracil1939-C5)-methyltransferase
LTNDTQIVKLISDAYGGEAFGRLTDGRATFVPLGIGGETVRIRPVAEKRGYVRAELVEVLDPSPARINPLCPHFGVCGGCHYQQIAYESQLEIKAAILREQLERVGGMKNPPIKPTIASPQNWNYRNHIQFHPIPVISNNGSSTQDPLCRLGFAARQTSIDSRIEQFIAVDVCHLPEAPLDTLWQQIDLESIPGLERISLRLGIEEDVLLVLESNTLEMPEFGLDLPLSAVHISPGGTIVLAGNEHIVMQVKDRDFHVSAASFFQVNSRMAERMVEHILENLALEAQDTLLDVYCGVGLFSAFLAPKVKRLIGIESSLSACADFEINLDAFDHVDLYEDGAERVLPSLKLRPDVVLVDPPRAGLQRAALDSILALEPRTIVYVSCDAATLARDAQRLNSGGYHLRQITPFDLFPQTYHIESISFWDVSIQQ